MAVMTVNGPVPKEALGVTLTHEHFFLDIRWAAPTSTEATQIALRDEPVTMRRLGALRRNPNTMQDNLLLADPELAAAEVMEYRKAGGRSIVDQSSIGTGRSPRAIRDLANQAGINVIMGCGFYLKGGLAPSLAEENLRIFEGGGVDGDEAVGAEDSLENFHETSSSHLVGGKVIAEAF